MITSLPPVPLGPCCACGQRDATTLCMLTLRSPTPGKGWGCAQCGLPNDGALAVLCDACVPLMEFAVDSRAQGTLPSWALLAELQTVCTGYALSDGRTAVDAFDAQPFAHDFSQHPETEWICRGCGCTQYRACETEDGPCRWAEPGLCSACAANENCL